MARISSCISAVHAVTVTGAGTNYVIVTPSGVIYIVFAAVNVSSTADGVKFTKSVDGGITWSVPAAVSAQTTIVNLAVWYDRWSGISGDLIHCAFTNVTNDDTNYRSINAGASDALSTETVIFAGGSTANGGALSITRARGGNLYCKTMIDAGAEGGFFRSVDVGANWTSRTDSEALATTDQWILMPGWAADNQDIMMFFWDASADEISRCLYDDSGNSWAETSISTGMVDQGATTNFPHFAAAVDTTNSQNLLLAWNGVDTANADLLGWKITESAITGLTDVVTNSTDDQGLVGLSIDTITQDWYAFYFGKSDGSETYAANIQLYYKKSTDDGATWGSETQVDPGFYTGPVGLFVCPRQESNGVPSLMYRAGASALIYSGEKPVVVQPTYALGI